MTPRCPACGEVITKEHQEAIVLVWEGDDLMGSLHPGLDSYRSPITYLVSTPPNGRRSIGWLHTGSHTEAEMVAAVKRMALKVVAP